MKLFKINRESHDDCSFSIKKTEEKHFLKIWHYHPEFELVLILKSSGTRFIGDSISKFSEGEIILLGPNLPHMWLNDQIYFKENSSLKASAIAVHFTREFLGRDFFETPQLQNINKLLNKAGLGLSFKKTNIEILNKIIYLNNFPSFERTIQFLEILDKLANCNYEQIASGGYLNENQSTSAKVFNKVYEYIFKNFKQPLNLDEVADLLPMNPSAFSRLFSRVHKKSFTRYVNEIRIGYACKLLIEQQYPINFICYESGFNSLSNFNKQFKSITGKTPSEYANIHFK